MINISKNCQQEKYAKFHYASRKMLFEAKSIKVLAYLLSFIPIILSCISLPNNKTVVFIATMISFGLTLVLEFTSTFLNNHKEKGILLGQLYNACITGTTFSKIQYDREMTNELNELAIRKSASSMSKLTEYHSVDVPDEIDEKYSYLYICRINAASTNYLMSRMYYFYIIVLAVIITVFTCFAFVKNDTYEFLQLIIQFYPLVIPIIRNIASSNKTMKYCTKISADIDNYFAEKNPSSDELARFVYYTQNLEFEAMMAAPAKYIVFYKVHKKGLKILTQGVTKRFIEASNFGKKKVAAKKETTKQVVAKEKPKVVAKDTKKEQPKTETAAKKNSTKTTENTKKQARNTQKQPQKTTKVKK